MTSLLIRHIHGRPYHPKTQGSVERANRTFKFRMVSYMKETGNKRWAQCIPGLARKINNTPSRVLPSHVTAYEAFYGHKNREFFHEKDAEKERAEWVVMEVDEQLTAEESALLKKRKAAEAAEAAKAAGDDEKEDTATEPEDEDERITGASSSRVGPSEPRTTIEQLVHGKNVQARQKIYADATLAAPFKVKDIVTLKINKKNRLPAEPMRLPCRVVGIRNGTAYALICKNGPIERVHQMCKSMGLRVFKNRTSYIKLKLEKYKQASTSLRSLHMPPLTEPRLPLNSKVVM